MNCVVDEKWFRWAGWAHCCPEWLLSLVVQLDHPFHVVAADTCCVQAMVDESGR